MEVGLHPCSAHELASGLLQIRMHLPAEALADHVPFVLAWVVVLLEPLGTDHQ